LLELPERRIKGKPTEPLVRELEDGRRSALARAISLVEDGSPRSRDILAWAFKNSGKARVIGITGAPGVGKSTLVDGLVAQLRDKGDSVGVIAVDPSSPFTGGAILGDRVRMRSHTTDPGVFFRSLASRGHLGGLSRHTGDVIALLDAFGFGSVVVETVGTGQSEIDIMKYAHTVVVVLAPGFGDEVQAIKAGILEIGDIFCVNKADTPDASRTVRELEMMLSFKHWDQWKPPIIETVAPTGHGLDKLAQSIEAHQEYLTASGTISMKLRERYRAVLEEYVRQVTVTKVMEMAAKDGVLEEVLASLIDGLEEPSGAAEKLIRKYILEGS